MKQHWIILFHHDYQLEHLEWGYTILVEPRAMQGRGTKYIKQDSQMQKSNASDDIQVFSKMFVSCYVHSFVTYEIAGPGMCNFKF